MATTLQEFQQQMNKSVDKCREMMETIKRRAEADPEWITTRDCMEALVIAKEMSELVNKQNRAMNVYLTELKSINKDANESVTVQSRND